MPYEEYMAGQVPPLAGQGFFPERQSLGCWDFDLGPRV